MASFAKYTLASLLKVFCHLTRQFLLAGNLLKIHIVAFEV